MTGTPPKHQFFEPDVAAKVKLRKLLTAEMILSARVKVTDLFLCHQPRQQ